MNQPINLTEKLTLNRINDQLYVNEERHLLIPSNYFGILQRDLIDNIGIERMKTFFFKHGWNIGAKDGKEILKDSSMNLMEKVLFCAVAHSFKGHVKITVTKNTLEIEDDKVTNFLFSGLWENSYEAEQHIQHLGMADHPICYTLMGYASGAVSHILGEKVFFKELECKGQGAQHCRWEGRLVSDWEKEAYQEFINSQDLPILKELEQTYEKLLHEKDTLSRVMKIEHELAESVVKGNNIPTIIELLEKHINKPIVVEDLYLQITDLTGMTCEEYEPIKREFQSVIKGDACIKNATIIKHSNYTRLVSPLFLQENIVGYCSFLYEKNGKVDFEIDSLIITVVSKMCSFVLLNEKVELESSERMKGYFFDEIMNGKFRTEQEFLKKAFFIDLDFTGGYHAIHLKYNEPTQHNNPKHHTEIFQHVSKFMSDKGVHVLMGQKPDSLLLLLPQKQLGEKTLEHVIYPLMSFLRKRLFETVCFIGVSTMHKTVLEEVKEAFKEAHTAVKLATRENPIVFFHELGILGVLVNDENKLAIRKIAQLTLGDLYKDVDQGKVELIETLYTFLSNGGNFELTADQLAISISGLRYRLNKITKLLGSDFRDPERRFQLLLSLKALLVIEDEWMQLKV